MKRNSYFPSLKACLLLLATLAGPVDASAEEAQVVYIDKTTDLRFPSTLSGLLYKRVVEYPDQKLGYCVLYEDRTAHGQICVYDLGYQELETGVDGTPFKTALGISVEALTKALNEQPHRNGKLVAAASPSIQGGGKVARAEARFLTSETELPGGKTQNLHLILMTTGFSKFLKLNYTARDMPSKEFMEETRRIVEQFVRFNGDTMKKLLVNDSAGPASKP
jgi:hypothetical protein